MHTFRTMRDFVWHRQHLELPSLYRMWFKMNQTLILPRDWGRWNQGWPLDWVIALQTPSDNTCNCSDQEQINSKQKHTLAIGPWIRIWGRQSWSSGLAGRRRRETDATLSPYRRLFVPAHSPPIGSQPSTCRSLHDSPGKGPPSATKIWLRW